MHKRKRIVSPLSNFIESIFIPYLLRFTNNVTFISFISNIKIDLRDEALFWTNSLTD